MQLGAPGIENAVDRPDAAVLGEVRGMGGVPVLRVGDRGSGGQGSLDLGVHQRHDLRATADRQATGRVGEVVLHVHDHERHLRPVSGIFVGAVPGARLWGLPAASHGPALLVAFDASA